MSLRRWVGPLAAMTLVLSGCDPEPAGNEDAGALRAFGEPCVATEDCVSGLCLALPGSARSVCTRFCGEDACPSGWGCVLPDGFPERVCGCAPASAVEICGNGLDDDCNGRADDCRVCGGVPVPETSTEHCGACGNRCSLGQECVRGACTCPSGTQLCGGACIDVRDDDDNCGACGRTCASGSSCNAGTCRCADSTLTMCGTTCVSLESSSANCGECGVACEGDLVCRAGECECVDAGDILCGDVCVSTSSDEAHCGVCDRACAAGQICSDGACTCPRAGDELCDGNCVSVATTSNCGSCDNACRPGEECSSGRCSCASGLVCGGVCVGTSDPRHCGACDAPCRADQMCDIAACVCPSGTWDCAGACTPIDEANCAGCGMSCGGGQICTSSRTCACAVSGRTYCPTLDACLDLQTDPSNCGTCGNVCSGAATCASGRCACPSGQTYCTGIGCVDTRSDMGHCGACGRVCASPQLCSAGTCACPSGGTFCSATGTCVDTRTDPANCGLCGNVCSAPRMCSLGSCRCATGLTYCSATGTCVDTRADASNCGACGRACTDGRSCLASVCLCPTPTALPANRLATTAGNVDALALSAGPGGAGLLWTDGSVSDIWFQRLGTDGAPVGVPISLDRPSPGYIGWDVALASSPAEWGAVWTNGETLEFQRLAPDGSALMPPRDLTSVCRWHPFVRWSPVLGWVVMCTRESGLDSMRLHVLGPLGDATAIPIDTGSGLLYGLAVAPDGRMLVAYYSNTPTSGSYGRMINADGSLTSSAFLVSSSSGARFGSVVWDGASFLATMNADSFSDEVWVHRGPTLADRVLVRSATGHASSAAISSFGGSAVVSFSWGTRDRVPADLWVARLAIPATPTGAPTVAAPAALLSTGTTVIDIPRTEVEQLGPDQVVHAWSDTRWGQTEPYSMGATLGMCR